MLLVIILFILGIVSAVLSEYYGARKHFSGNDTNIVKDDEVTVEDMVLHDMNNNDDTYDIGAIDFND